MGMMKEYYHDEINQIDDVDDIEYFQWLTDAEWQHEVEAQEEKLRKQYGNGAMFNKFLNKNCEL